MTTEIVKIDKLEYRAIIKYLYLKGLRNMGCQFKNVLTKLRTSCGCSVSKNAHIAGWLGMVWRSITSVLVAYYFKKASLEDPTIYQTVLLAGLSYLLISFAANVFFLIGIVKSWWYVLLPYIIIQGIELIIYVFLCIVLATVLNSPNVAAPLWLVETSLIVILALNTYFFTYSLIALRDIEAKTLKKKEEDKKATEKSKFTKEPRKSLRAIRQGRYRNTAQL